MLVLVVKNLEKKQQLHILCEYHMNRQESENTTIFLSSRVLGSLCSSLVFIPLLHSLFCLGSKFQLKNTCSYYETKLDFLGLYQFVILNVRYTRSLPV